MSDLRSRNFVFLLYPENAEHIQALEKLKSSCDAYAYILHDKDVDENGSLKKPHIHFVAMLASKQNIDRLCAALGIPSNYCDVIRGSVVGSLRYLIHRDDPDKYQYDVSDVLANFVGLKRFRDALSVRVDESDAVQRIMEFIYCSPSFLTVSDLTRFVLENGLWSVYRRSFPIFKEVLRETNFEKKE